MDPAFFEITKTGEVLSRLTTDTTLIQSLSGAGLSILLRSTLSFLGSLVLLLFTSLKLALIIFALIPAVLVPMLIFGRWVRRLSRASQDRNRRHLGARRRNAQRHSDRAGVHARRPAARPVRLRPSRRASAPASAACGSARG
jgi:ABC-type multidrug transport system fused ATPase/permease subunit